LLLVTAYTLTVFLGLSNQRWLTDLKWFAIVQSHGNVRIGEVWPGADGEAGKAGLGTARRLAAKEPRRLAGGVTWRIAWQAEQGVVRTVEQGGTR
jgi:hypothetical protein